jgi:hypothetical protein
MDWIYSEEYPRRFQDRYERLVVKFEKWRLECDNHARNERVPESLVRQVVDCEVRMDLHEGKMPREAKKDPQKFLFRRRTKKIILTYPKPHSHWSLRPRNPVDRSAILTYGQLTRRLDRLLDRLWEMLTLDWPATPTTDEWEYHTKIVFHLADRILRPSRARTI